MSDRMHANDAPQAVSGLSLFRQMLAKQEMRQRWEAANPALAAAWNEALREDAAWTTRRDLERARSRACFRAAEALRRIRAPEDAIRALEAPTSTPSMDAAHAFVAASRKDVRFLLLLGEKGIGKTVGACYVAREAIADFYTEERPSGGPERPEPAAFVNGSELSRLSAYGDGASEFERLQRVSVLVLDDLTRAFVSKVSGPMLFELLDCRYRRLKATVITDNKLPDEFARWCAAQTDNAGNPDACPLWDRIETSAIVAALPGESLRRTKKRPEGRKEKP